VTTAERLTAATGLAFALSFAAGVLMLGDVFGMLGDRDFVFEQYYADDHPYDVASAAVLGASGLLFPAFIVGLTGDSYSRAGILAVTLAGVFAAVVLVGASAAGAIPAARLFGGLFDDGGQGATAVWFPPTLGAILVFVAAPVAAAGSIAATSFDGSSVLSRGLTRGVSLAAAFVLLFSAAFLPLTVLPAWAAFASARVWLSGARTGRQAAA
jgi:hypothetical protein